jgi:hypothetical protein
MKNLIKFTLAFWCALLLPSVVLAQTFTQSVTFTLNPSQAGLNGTPTTNCTPPRAPNTLCLYILIDKDGGRNSLNNAKKMNVNNGNFQITVDLEEGDYVYVFAFNVEDFVDLTDLALNPDDVPDSNFLNDPTPLFPGKGGQFSTDNIFLVRNPARPVFDVPTFTPGAGAIVTTGGALNVSIKVNAGNTGNAPRALNARVSFEQGLAKGLTIDSAIDQDSTFVSASTVNFNPATGILTASVPNPEEGFRRVRFEVDDVTGTTAFPFEVMLTINRQNQAPIADAGPTAWGQTNRGIELDGGLSLDPDEAGLTEFQWATVFSPCNQQRTFSSLIKRRSTVMASDILNLMVMATSSATLAGLLLWPAPPFPAQESGL